MADAGAAANAVAITPGAATAVERVPLHEHSRTFSVGYAAETVPGIVGRAAQPDTRKVTIHVHQHRLSSLNLSTPSHRARIEEDLAAVLRKRPVAAAGPTLPLHVHATVCVCGQHRGCRALASRA